MKISKIANNMSFKRLKFDKGAEKILYSEILATPKDESTLKEILMDTIEVQKSQNNHVYVRFDGSVEIDSEWTKGKSLSYGRNLFERYELALRAARSDKYQEFLTDKKEHPFIDIDV